MPDVIATDAYYERSLVIECKSGYAPRLYVDIKQVHRQKRWVSEAILPNPVSVFAFKFAEGHSPIHWYWVMPDDLAATAITCKKDGTIIETGTKKTLGQCSDSLQTTIYQDML